MDFSIKMFVLFLAIGLIVTRVPVIGKYFRSVNTMFHEDGHAIFSLIFGKGTDRIELFANTEGVAQTYTNKGILGWIPRILISIAGYPFASFIAFVFYYFLVKEQYDVLLYGLFVTIVLNLILWVRNSYGIIWLVTFGGILGYLYYLGNGDYIAYFMLFIGSILLVESVYSSLIILILSIKQPDDAGDSTSLRKSTMISSRFWGLLFFVQSLYFGYEIIKLVN